MIYPRSVISNSSSERLCSCSVPKELPKLNKLREYSKEIVDAEYSTHLSVHFPGLLLQETLILLFPGRKNLASD